MLDNGSKPEDNEVLCSEYGNVLIWEILAELTTS